MKFKQNIIANKWFLLIIVLVVGCFYWFQFRPSTLKQECQEWAREMGDVYFSYEFVQKEEPLKRSQLQTEYMEQAYNRCLHDKGL